MSALTASDALVADLVDANHILYNEGVLDGFGHVSARHDKDPGKFLLSRSLAPALVTREDLQESDLDCNTPDPRRPYLERFIHGEIYRVRPDVMAVVHSHSTAIIPFGVSGAQLRPVFHMCGFLAGPAPVFEIREAGGPETDMLIRSKELGAALARTLGYKPFALMRGHGCVAVGASVKQAVYRAIYAEVNARLQMDAMRLGEVTYLNEAEAAKADASNMSVLDRPWELWKSKLRR